ncbi:hypothetical protein [Streptococcus suis]|uniref:hypothetical protein n=1 Tax=Streptococcus suis TaxID=1307 RepID=UPI00129010FD|nr:hypothetical protein [Streptococcus suis]
MKRSSRKWWLVKWSKMGLGLAAVTVLGGVVAPAGSRLPSAPALVYAEEVGYVIAIDAYLDGEYLYVIEDHPRYDRRSLPTSAADLNIKEYEPIYGKTLTSLKLVKHTEVVGENGRTEIYYGEAHFVSTPAETQPTTSSSSTSQSSTSQPSASKPSETSTSSTQPSATKPTASSSSTSQSSTSQPSETSTSSTQPSASNPTETKVTEDQVSTSPVYRLYHEDLKVHLYTIDAYEYKVLAGRGWRQEGQAFLSASKGSPVYRLYHESLKVHLYTRDAHEYKVLAGRGWRQEGTAFYSVTDGIPVYRLYNEGLKKHLYTTDANEYKVLATRGWTQEGIAFYSAK